jgi:DNA-binding NtrC family response regulator
MSESATLQTGTHSSTARLGINDWGHPHASEEAEHERILVVDDSPETVEWLQGVLAAEAYRVVVVTNVGEALGLLDRLPIHLVVAGVQSAQGSGLELVRHISENFEETDVIVITGHPSVQTAVSAIKMGAAEYLAKPLTAERLLDAIRATLENAQIRHVARRDSKKSQTKVTGTQWGLIGESKGMLEVYQAIRKLTRSDNNVLIRGETGTGKDLVARAIHSESSRSSAPFVPINCASLPEALIESELFGARKGAYTGADATRVGAFRAAEH